MLSNLVLAALAVAPFGTALPQPLEVRGQDENMLSFAAKLQSAYHARLPFPAALYGVSANLPSSPTDNPLAMLANITSTYISSNRNPAKGVKVSFADKIKSIRDLKPIINTFAPDTAALAITGPLNNRAFSSIRVSLKEALAKAQAAIASAGTSPSSSASTQPSTTSSPPSQTTPTTAPTDGFNIGVQPSNTPTTTASPTDGFNIGVQPSGTATTTSDVDAAASITPAATAEATDSFNVIIGRHQEKRPKVSTSSRPSVSPAVSSIAPAESLGSGVSLIAAKKGAFANFEANPSWYVFSSYDASGARVADIVIGTVSGVHRVPGGIFKSATVF